MNEFEGGRNSSGLEGRSEDIHVHVQENEKAIFIEGIL